MTLDPSLSGANCAIAIASRNREGADLESSLRGYFSRSRESRLNALTYLAEAEALEQARALEARRADAERLPLFGVPIAVKDAICTRGIPTTAGSNVLRQQVGDRLEGYRPPYDASVIERLKAAGAIVIAKTNMDEFAMGSSNENSAYGPVQNPWDISRIPGGSSGGSAAAVAAGLAPVALGSDTGGSIRQPASLCGLVGVKPSFGRVSRYGLIAYASSLDQIGPLTPDVRSAARVMEVIAGHDARDSTSVDVPVGAYEKACELPLSGLRVGLPEEYFAEGLEPAVRERILDVVEQLKSQGVSVKSVKLPHTAYGIACYYLIATAEASTNLSRFDGVRYGLRNEPEGEGLRGLYEATRTRGFGDEVKRRIVLGTYALSAGYYDAYYGKAQKVRALIQRDFDAVFSEVDVLVTPASPTPAFRIGEKTNDPLAMYLADIYTLPASLAGISGMSVPVGNVRYEGSELPVGVQLLGAKMAEETLFRAATGIESLAKRWA